MTYVIGDIHGEYEKLLRLLKHIPLGEKLVFIGDYINKGKKSKEVLDHLNKISMLRETVFLFGNHEFKLLQAWEGNQQAIDYLKQYGFKETLESFLDNKLTDRRFEMIMITGDFKEIVAQYYTFFKKLKKFHREKNYFIIHAGIPMSGSGRFNLGSLERTLFIREEFLNCKKKYDGRIVVFGHTAFPEVFWDGYKLGIDTGAVYSQKRGFGRLTAVHLESFRCLDDTGKRSRPILTKNRKITLVRKKWQEV